MICGKCGSELEEGALYCGSCGAKVEAAEAPKEQAEAEEKAKETFTPAEPQAIKPVQEGKPVSMATWLCRDLILLIPCVGWVIYLVMLFVWSFDNKYNETSRNWARAKLVYMGICLAIIIVLVIVAVSAGTFYTLFSRNSYAPKAAPGYFFDIIY